MVPTALGVQLIKAIESVEPTLVRPQLRGRMEKDITEIATGVTPKDVVVARTISSFRERYCTLSSHFEQLLPFFACSGVLGGADYTLLGLGAAGRGGGTVKLKHFSDGQMRREDDRDEVASALASHGERERLEADRAATLDRAAERVRGEGGVMGRAAELLGGLFSYS
jgi:hypothetical protein